MKALTVHQPWASLIAFNEKRFETRGWKMNYRGKLAIHAGKHSPESHMLDTKTQKAMYQALRPHFFREKMANWSDIEHACPLGGIVAIADLVDVWRSSDSGYTDTSADIYANGCRGYGKCETVNSPEFLFGDFSPGRFALDLQNVILLPKPIYCNGRQGLWDCVTEITNAYYDPVQTREMKEILRQFIKPQNG